MSDDDADKSPSGPGDRDRVNRQGLGLDDVKQLDNVDRSAEALLSSVKMMNSLAENLGAYSAGSGSVDFPHSPQGRGESVQQHQGGVSVSTTEPISTIQQGIMSDSTDLISTASSSSGVQTSSLSAALQDSQKRVKELRLRVQEAYRLCDEQKKHFREHIEILHGRLQDTIIGRNSVMDLRKVEAKGQEVLLNKLQATLMELDQANQLQEKTIGHANSKVQLLHTRLMEHEALVDKIQSILRLDQTSTHRGLLDSVNIVQTEGINQLAERLQTYIETNRNALEEKSTQFQQVTAQLNSIQSETADCERGLKIQMEDRIRGMTDEYQTNVTVLKQQLSSSESQIQTLTEKLRSLYEASNTQLSAKDSKVDEVERRCEQLRDVVTEIKSHWQEDRIRLTSAMNTYKQQLDEIIASQESNRSHNDRHNTTVENLKEEVSRLNVQVQSEKNSSEILSRELKQTRSDLQVVQTAAAEKNLEIGKLQISLNNLEQQHVIDTQRKMTQVEKDHHERGQIESQKMMNEKREMSDRLVLASSQLQQKSSEIRCFHDKIETLIERINNKQQELASTVTERNSLKLQIDTENKETHSLKQECDQYMKLNNELNESVKVLIDGKQKLETQLKERDRSIQLVLEENQVIHSRIEESHKAVITIRDDRNHVMGLLHHHMTEGKHLHEIAMEMKHRISLVELENARLTGELDKRNTDLHTATDDHGGVTRENLTLNDKITQLNEELSSFKKSFESQGSDKDREFDKLMWKYRSAQEELAAIRRAISDNGQQHDDAMKMASSLQKQLTLKRTEIDKLATRFTQIEDNSIRLTRDLKKSQDEQFISSDKITGLNSENDKMTREMESWITRENNYREQIENLERNLHKMSSECAGSQIHVAELEQEITRLKLKHTLALNEVKYSMITNSVTQTSTGLFRKDDTVGSINEHVGTQTDIHSGSRHEREKHEIDDNEQELINTELHKVLNDLRHFLSQYENPFPVAMSRKTQRFLPSWADEKLTEDSREYPCCQHNDETLLLTPREEKIKKQSVAPMTSSPIMRNVSHRTDDDTHSNPLQDKPNPLSLQAEQSLLISQIEDLTKNCSLNSTVENTYTYTGVGNDRAKELCRKLENKVQTLSQIAGKLMQENKGMASLMSDHDKNLKNIRAKQKNGAKSSKKSLVQRK